MQPTQDEQDASERPMDPSTEDNAATSSRTTPSAQDDQLGAVASDLADAHLMNPVVPDDAPVPVGLPGGDVPPMPNLSATNHLGEVESDAPLSEEQSPAGPVTESRRGYPPVNDDDRPSYVFLGVVAALSLFADIATKVWAEITLNERGFEPIAIIGDNLNIILAYNPGGAWGMGAGVSEMLRKPFFFGVSLFAIIFILSLYSRLHPAQKALKWGLPLVLGGALGNLCDRITRSQVIDFIDYRADWVMSLNSFVKQFYSSWALTDHWPTFNVADIAICIGVILMGVDMITHRHHHVASAQKQDAPPPADETPAVG